MAEMSGRDGSTVTGDGELLARNDPIEHPPTVVA
jgi:hypothetical protein